MFTYRFFAVLGLVIFLSSCGKNVDNLANDKLFTVVPANITGVTFSNNILESEKLHYYKYQYIYIGGGVAAADFNNDGLEDLFFTSNIYHNKLYINKGNFKFEDITQKAGIEKRVGFDVGVSVADVNNDGFLDIYINRAGWYTGNERLANMLYINNGDLTFTEKAAEYGLDDSNRSIASTFFDYDKDGDLDLYIANAPSDFSITGTLLDLKEIQRQGNKIAASKSSDKLYRNNGNGSFTDVSKEAGILPDLGFGLNPQVGDLNNDGWLDVYVSNDFITPDFAYINNGDGTFTDKRNDLFKHIPYYSMGSDVADVNNDGLADLMVLDMSPEDYIRSKTTMAMMPIDRFYEMIDKDYHYQYMHNMLQLNNGNGTYSEIANFSGLAKTDWSWATLLADFDLDGYNDVYVTNGVYRDVVDRDVNIEINNYIKQNKAKLTEKDFFEFTKKLPQQKLPNYFFKNNGDLSFSNTTQDWVTDNATFSNGAVYADLDNDGDLDLVVNNIEDNATILKNNTIETTQNNYVQFQFNGAESNPKGVGVKLVLYQENSPAQTRQLINNRGYLSSTPNKLYFGLGKNTKITKVEVFWPDGKYQELANVKANQLITVNYNAAVNTKTNQKTLDKFLFAEETLVAKPHVEPFFNDFDKQLLLPHKLSQTGPAFAKADVNNDGVDDFYIGGAHLEAGQLLLSSGDTYTTTSHTTFNKDKVYEDVSAAFLDVDNDNDLDLYVASGSYEFTEGSKQLEDRLYINNGSGVFTKSTGILPSITTAAGIVTAADYDNDGDTDVFVGSRVIPGKYPYAPTSYLLINTNGKLEIQTQTKAKELEKVGMVTFATWNDLDIDGDLDLIVTGEWMGIEVFLNNDGYLQKTDEYQTLTNARGWWNTLKIADVDNDGNKDIIAGNLGLNYKFHASQEKPFHIYTNDFDNNGVEDIVLAKYYKEKQVPVRGKSCTSQQMPFIKDKFKKYNDFAQADLKGIFGDEIEASLHYTATEFRSGVFYGSEQGFNFQPFQNHAQLAPVNAIIYYDFDADGKKDLLLTGNNHQAEVETTRSDAGIGVYLKGVEGRKFIHQSNTKTGFVADKDVRAAAVLSGKKPKVLVVNNNANHTLYTINNN
jgi:hypothetical protein